MSNIIKFPQRFELGQAVKVYSDDGEFVGTVLGMDKLIVTVIDTAEQIWTVNYTQVELSKEAA